MATLKELRAEAKAKKIANWWNKNTAQLTEELAALNKTEEKAADPEPVAEAKKEEPKAEPEKKAVPKADKKAKEAKDGDQKRNKCMVDDVPLSEWCKKNNMPYFTVYDRINRLGWPVEKATTTPVRAKKG